jgi:hypothetical protein
MLERKKNVCKTCQIDVETSIFQTDMLRANPNSATTFSIMTLSRTEYHGSFPVHNVTLAVILLKVILLKVIQLYITLLKVIIQMGVILLNVILLNKYKYNCTVLVNVILLKI